MPDATGTPTSLGIPTYNTSVDPPSGKGFNSAMAEIDSLIADRVEVPSGIASGEVPVWDGSGWARSTTTKIGLSSLTDPGSGKVIGSNSGAAAVFPPSYEFASVNLSTDSGPTGVTPTGNGDPLMNFPAGTFDGGMVACELTVSPIETGGIVGSYAQFSIAESTTLVTNWVQFVRDQSQPSLPKTTFFKLFFLSAPTAGSHSYTLRWRAPSGGTWTLKSAVSGFETTRARIVKV